MKNKLVDLNNHLFAQLERLSCEEIAKEELATEIERSKAITSVANQIILNAKLALDAQVKINEHLIKKPPVMLGDGYNETD